MSDYNYIDLTYLNDLALGSRDFVEDMIQSFLSTAPESLTKLETNLAEKNWKQIGSIAHKLKTSFSFMGMDDMVQVSKTLQDSGLNERDVDTIPNLIEQMKEAFEKASVELKQELENTQKTT